MHVPFCSTICFYCACNKINTANRKRADQYVRTLIREMALQRQLIDGPHSIEQLHFGGGTPTFLDEEQIDRVFDGIRSSFNLSENASRDFSIEIDPRHLDPKRIDHLASHGINRISIGVQDFDPAVQVAVNRVQSVGETRAVMDAARANGIRSINVDLINGLPKQTASGFTRTLEQVIELQPDRLSLYSYAHLPQRFKTQRQINADDLPGPELKLTLLETAVNRLTDAGYVYIGMDHFAKASDSLIQAQQQGTLHRNFQGYTTHGHCHLIGLGVSSIGHVGRVYVQNTKTLPEYYAAIGAGNLAIVRGIEINGEDVIVGQVIQDLMCNFEVDLPKFETATGVAFCDFFADQWPGLQEFEQQDLLVIGERRLTVTDRGRFLIRNICMLFDAYLNRTTELFSKAI